MDTVNRWRVEWMSEDTWYRGELRSTPEAAERELAGLLERSAGPVVQDWIIVVETTQTYLRLWRRK
jgi:hypothetical protein